MTQTLTVGSLFSGIGGLDLGLERAGMKVVWQVEKDPYAQNVLRKNFPGCRLYDDVCTVRDLEPVDLICGGFPCQDISNAGKRSGIAGARSGLWTEFHRIINEVRPTWVLIENVSALRSRGLGVVLRDLSASGYDAEWDCIPASALGAPHRRDRIFIVAHAQRDILRLEQGRGSGTDGQGAHVFGQHGQHGHVADAERKSRGPRRAGDAEQGAGGRNAGRGGVGAHGLVGRQEPAWSTEPDVGRVAHGVPARVHRLRVLGNAVVPQVAEYVGRRIARVVLKRQGEAA